MPASQSSVMPASQTSLLSDYRIPRRHLKRGDDELVQKAAIIMGSMAKSVMEGGATMLKEYLEASDKSNNSG